MNRFATGSLVVLSLGALVPLLIAVGGVVVSGQLPAKETDEGTGAHIFQLSIAAMLPAGLFFLATADWSRPAQIARRLAFPTVAVLLAFAMLYWYEHAL